MIMHTPVKVSKKRFILYALLYNFPYVVVLMLTETDTVTQKFALEAMHSDTN